MVSGYMQFPPQYRELVAPLERFIPSAEQEAFKEAHILVAGCGRIGNPVAEMSVRHGAENIVVADPDTVDNSNLSGQRYSIDQVGRNKAQMTARNLRNINPVSPEKEIIISDGISFRVVKEASTSGIRSVKEGITYENVGRLVAESDIIVDGIDIRALDVMYELHRVAAEQRKPVIVGYDMAGTALVAIYRYDLEEMEPLNGELTAETIEVFKEVRRRYELGDISEANFMNFVNACLKGPISPLDVPTEQIEELLTRVGGERTPQLGTTATMISALVVETIRAIVSGKEVNDKIVVDSATLVLRRKGNFIKKLGLLLRLLPKLEGDKRNMKELLDKIPPN